MLVMEYVSGFGLLPLGQSMPNFRISPDIGDGLGPAHFFPSTSSATTPTHSFFVVGQATRLYAKGPSSVQVCADRDSHTATAAFTASVSGYLVNLP
jgi:hypothetical protein